MNKMKHAGNNKGDLMSKIVICFTAIAILLAAVSSASAQTVQITNGLSYLSTTQNPDGSWGSEASGREILPATTSVIETMQFLNQTNTAGYGNAISWLQSQGLDTTDYLSERIYTLSVSGTDLNLLLSYIDQFNNAWGGYDDYEVNNLDTMLSISALRKLNYPDQTVISTAIGYLISNQNTDGGFGFYAGDDSNVYMTAMVVNTLLQYKASYNLQASINNGVSYLLTKQNPDGGFGSSPSTVYETALSFEALIASGAIGADKAGAMQNAINYLTTTQSLNGSWNDDPYSTALKKYLTKAGGGYYIMLKEIILLGGVG